MDATKTLAALVLAASFSVGVGAGAIRPAGVGDSFAVGGGPALCWDDGTRACRHVPAPALSSRPTGSAGS